MRYHIKPCNLGRCTGLEPVTLGITIQAPYHFYRLLTNTHLNYHLCFQCL
ncbi:hypothetical protein PROAA_2990006 [Candidatus Propionivibrio aalborgensis]|uniref:Uncharacterized protein n=1 Tax=Candidatus Propionivibrio aalborgensis TaxID=1860101 RepID=A0A1A8XWF9_9RHOO|nr:hypothetical protein PROAA_2990006 [Candidatus Propionivibrio aalborgensis]